MTSSSPSNPSFDWFNPSPQQDSDLLAQIGFIPGFKEFLTLRQVHALEHATVWVLISDPATGSRLGTRHRLGIKRNGCPSSIAF